MGWWDGASEAGAPNWIADGAILLMDGREVTNCYFVGEKDEKLPIPWILVVRDSCIIKLPDD